MSRLPALLIAITLILFSSLLLAEEDADVPQNIEDLRAEIQKILDAGDIPGASIALVSKDGTLWAGGVGKADLAADRDATADTLFRVGSISKSFTALAVMTGVERGLIDLGASIREAAPGVDFSNPWEEKHPVTLAMVMEHTAGFDDIHAPEYAWVDDPDITIAEGLAYHPDSRTSRWKPGMHMSYCNSGPPIAAFALERVSGKKFEDYTREHVFDVLGMDSTTFYYPENVDLIAKGYQDDGVTEANYDHIIIRPSGALNSSAREMAIYLRMMINRGRINGTQFLQPETISRIETPTSTLAARDGHTLGYGLGNYSSIVNGHLFHGHDGGITGFAATSAYSSELGLGFFIAINKPSGELSDIRKLIGKYLTAGIDPPSAPTVKLSAKELDEIAGYYQLITPRAELLRFVTRFFGIGRVTLEDGKLFLGRLLGGDKKEMIPVSAGGFRLQDNPVATQFLVTDEAGDTIFQFRFGNNSRKISGFSVYLQISIAVLTLLLLVSSLLFALVWVPARLFGKMKSLPLKTVFLPLLTILTLIVSMVAPVLLSNDTVQDLGNRTVYSLTIFMGTLLFALLTLYSVFSTWREYAGGGGRVRLHSLLVSIACLVTLLYLGWHGLVGLKTWDY